MSRSSRDRSHESSDARFVALLECFGATLRKVCPDRAGRSFCLLARARGWRAVVSMHALDGKCPFTARQSEVLELIGRDLRNHGTAEYLGIAVETVKDHVRELMDRTDIRTRAGLVRYSFEKIFTRMEEPQRRGASKALFDGCLDTFLTRGELERLAAVPRGDRLLMRTLDDVHATVALAPDELPPELGPDQHAMIDLLGRGLGDAGIAARLAVSASTVKARLRRAKRAYGVKSRAALVRRVLEVDLDDAHPRASRRRGHARRR